MTPTDRAPPRPLRPTALGVLLVGLCLTMTACDFSDPSDCSPDDTSALRSPETTWTSPNVEHAGAFGREVTVLGDVNGDGTRDVAVGGHGESVDGTDSAGRVYVLGGAEGTLLHTLTSPNAQSYGLFGNVLAGVGDVDGDGTGDLLVGAPSEAVGDSTEAGRAYLFGGADGRLIRTLTSPTLRQHGGFGEAVAGLDDVDGDATPDLAVVDGSTVRLLSGADGRLLRTLTLPDGAFLGTVAGLGDVDGDGTGDLLVSAPDDTVNGTRGAGRVYLFSGADGRRLHSLPTPNPGLNGHFGGAAAGVGDVNGDGTPDVLVGARVENEGKGRAYLFSGADGRLLQTLTSPHASEHGYFGRAVAEVGDADGDGTPDVLVGAPGESVKGGGCGPAGRVYLFSGTSGEHLRTFESPNPESPGNFGKGIAGRSAPDESGAPSLFVGAPSETVDGKGSAGRAYLFPARPE